MCLEKHLLLQDTFDIERCYDVEVLTEKILQIEIKTFGKPFMWIRNKSGPLGMPESIFS